MFVACSSDEPIAPTIPIIPEVIEMNIRIKNIGTEVVPKLIIYTSGQTITRDALAPSEITDYYNINIVNANSEILLSIEDETGFTSETVSLVFGDSGNYTIEAFTNADITTFGANVLQD